MVEIHIAYCSDNRFAPYLGVSLTSILLNSRADEKLNIYIVNRNISLENKRKIASLKQIKDFSLSFLAPETGVFESYLIKEGCTLETCYRLALPDLLPDLDKVIYLDCDLIVRRSLSELWACDVSNFCLGAAPDLIDYLPFSSWKNKQRLNGNTAFSYFNAGVLVLNLRAMQYEDLFRRCMVWMQSHRFTAKFCDQDGLNGCLLGNFKQLPPEWNVQTPMYWPGAVRILKRRTDTLLALSDPAIVHFTTGEKPWKQYSFCKWKKLFHQYRLQTPWHNSPVFDHPKPKITVTAVRRVKRWGWLRILWLGGIGASWFFRQKN